MKRLFVKVKTNPKSVGTLLEVNRENTIGRTLEQIVRTMEGLAKVEGQGQFLDYCLVRLGSPNRVLQNQQTFSESNTRNGDSLLLVNSADANVLVGHFNFDPLLNVGQEVFVQDLRAPIRSPLDLGVVMQSVPVRDLEDVSLSHAQEIIQPEDAETPRIKDQMSAFEFERLDIDLSGEEQSDTASLKKDASTVDDKEDGTPH